VRRQDRDLAAPIAAYPGRQDSLRVGYKLYRELVDFLPAKITSAELVVALIIADDAGEETRRSWIRTPVLLAKTRLTVTAMRGAFQRLDKRGYHFRVAHGYGSDGRPVYAARGHPPEYLVPLVAEIRAAEMGLSLDAARPP
jgi:hypothetical protein